MKILNWNVEAHNQGQMVTEQYPQLSGAAEGTEGPAKGLRLVYDASDGEWVLYGDQELNTVIARGNRFEGQDQPSVDEAMRLVNRCLRDDRSRRGMVTRKVGE